MKYGKEGNWLYGWTFEKTAGFAWRSIRKKIFSARLIYPARKKWKWRRTCVAYGDHGLSFTGVFQWACWYYQSHAYVSDPWCSGDRRRGILMPMMKKARRPRRQGKRRQKNGSIPCFLRIRKRNWQLFLTNFEESKTPESKLPMQWTIFSHWCLTTAMTEGTGENTVSAQSRFTAARAAQKKGSEKLYEVTDQIIKKHREKGNLKWN